MFLGRLFDKSHIFQERFFPLFRLYSKVRDLGQMENISPLFFSLPTKVIKLLGFICECLCEIPLPTQPISPRVTYQCQLLENFLIILIHLYLTLPQPTLLLIRPIGTSRQRIPTHPLIYIEISLGIINSTLQTFPTSQIFSRNTNQIIIVPEFYSRLHQDIAIGALHSSRLIGFIRFQFFCDLYHLSSVVLYGVPNGLLMQATAVQFFIRVNDLGFESRGAHVPVKLFAAPLIERFHIVRIHVEIIDTVQAVIGGPAPTD